MDEKERQYREYLALRQHEQEDEINREYYGHEEKNGRNDTFGRDEKYGQFFPDDRNRPRRVSITETPYGASELRKAQKEKERRDREMQEYLKAREADRNRRGVRSGVRRADHGEYDGTKQSRKKIRRKKQKPVIRTGFERKKRRAKPTTTIAIVFVLAAVIAVGGLAMLFSIVGSAEHIAIDKNDIGINETAAASIDGYRNILVLGTDARKGEEDGMVRSDAIIVASINEDTDEVKLFSVFRDTLLDVGDGDLDKITHAYAYGGAQQSLKAINKNLDLNID